MRLFYLQERTNSPAPAGQVERNRKLTLFVILLALPYLIYTIPGRALSGFGAFALLMIGIYIGNGRRPRQVIGQILTVDLGVLAPAEYGFDTLHFSRPL